METPRQDLSPLLLHQFPVLPGNQGAAGAQLRGEVRQSGEDHVRPRLPGGVVPLHQHGPHPRPSRPHQIVEEIPHEGAVPRLHLQGRRGVPEHSGVRLRGVSVLPGQGDRGQGDGQTPGGLVDGLPTVPGHHRPGGPGFPKPGKQLLDPRDGLRGPGSPDLQIPQGLHEGGTPFRIQGVGLLQKHGPSAVVEATADFGEVEVGFREDPVPIQKQGANSGRVPEGGKRFRHGNTSKVNPTVP